eukprot:1137037-Pelagomonas_calceolata.AAC.5
MDKSRFCPAEDSKPRGEPSSREQQNPADFVLKGHQDGQEAAPSEAGKEATPTEQSTGQSSGAGGGLSSLPRPPPLTIPAGANVSNDLTDAFSNQRPV